ncbi:MAG: hypothetical protein ACRDRH_11270 [Pseudonocardia sp.]
MLIDETLAALPLDSGGEAPLATHAAPDSPLVLTVGSASKIF